MKPKHWIKIAVFALLTAVMLVAASTFLIMPYAKDVTGIYGFRLEPEDSLDVVLVGASSIYTSFYSPLAYEEQGFTSYSLSVSAMTASLYETAVEEALATQDPDLFVVELWGFAYKDQITETALRKFLDVIPYASAARKEAIETIVPEDLKDSFINPLLKYHGNWTSFADCVRAFADKLAVQKQGYSITKNYSSRTRIFSTSGDSNYRITQEGMDAVDRFLAFCKEKGLKNVLFLRGPEQLNYVSQPSYYEMLDKIEAAGYDFLDMNAIQDEYGIDPSHDWCDTGHLNIYGSVKYTRYLAAYLMEHYDIDTTHSPEVTEEWDYCASFNEGVIRFLQEKAEADEDRNRFTQQDLLEWAY